MQFRTRGQFAEGRGPMFAGRDPFSGHRFWKGPLVHRVGNIVRYTNASKSMFYRVSERGHFGATFLSEGATF